MGNLVMVFFSNNYVDLTRYLYNLNPIFVQVMVEDLVVIIIVQHHYFLSSPCLSPVVLMRYLQIQVEGWNLLQQKNIPGTHSFP